MFGLGAPELVLILLIVVVLFGATKIPALGRSVGEGLSNFKRGLREAGDDPPRASPQPPPQQVVAKVIAPPNTLAEPQGTPREHVAANDVPPPRS